MAGDPKSPDSFLDLNFQSLAARELNAKQMELDSATAKLDELRRELEKRRSPGGPGKGEYLEVLSHPSSAPTLSPSLTRRSHSSSALSSMANASSQQSHWPRSQDSSLSVPMTTPLMVTSSSSSIPVLSLNSSPSMTRRSLPSDSSDQYLSTSSRSPRGRPLSPRPQYSRLSSSSYDYAMGPRSASPVPEGQLPISRYSDWTPPLRQPSAYEVPPGFAPPRFSDDVSSVHRRAPQRSWNESDLDKVYEKKPSQDRLERASLGGVPVVKAWRESSLDSAPMKGKNEASSTLPRAYKFSGWKSGGGTLPRSFPSQQPISRIPVPPPGGRGQPHRPLPLSMIFRLQNQFWEHQVPPQINATSPPMSLPVAPLPSIPVIADTPSPAVAPAAPEEVPRPLSPTRLQPHLPPQMADVQRVLEDIPRPLRRRGSQEHTSLAPPLPSDRRQYRQIMGRLFGRAASKSSVVPDQPRAEEKLQGSVGKGNFKPEEATAEEMTAKIPPIPEEPRHEEKHEASIQKPTEDPVYIFLETSESRVGASVPPQGEVELPVPMVVSAGQPLELRSALKVPTSPRKSRPRRARLDPLILLLDGALSGELDVVTQALREVNDPSQPNEEGITALHNAICGANFHIVSLLITSGANVNAADSHGWTPLHCAASCNDLQICAALVRHGAAIFATTFSDGSLPVDKCDPYREGYKECLTYLTEVEECMGETQSGVVYALWDYSAEFADELSVREGDSVTVLRKDGEGGTWWWAAHCGREGYVPRNYFGMYPRLRPQRSPL